METYDTHQKYHFTGWFLITCIIGTAFYYHFKSHLNSKEIFVTLILVAVTLSSFQLIHNLVPGFFLILSFIGFGLGSPPVILSGFATSLFFLGLCLFIIEGYLISNRVYERFVEWFLRFFPLSPFWMFFCIYLMGLFMTLTILSLQNRFLIAQCIYKQWVAYVNAKIPSRYLSFFCMGFYQACFIFSPIFLTGSIYNLIVISFFYNNATQSFTWFSWFIYASVPFIILWAGIIIFIWFASFYKKINIHYQKTLQHMALMGHTRWHERICLMAAFILISGFLTFSFHYMEAYVWAGIVVLFLLLSPLVSFDRAQKQIAWQDLILLGCIGCIAPVATYINAFEGFKDLILFNNYILTHHILYLISLALFVCTIRILLSYQTVIIVGSCCLIPLVYFSPIQGWIIIFTFLMAASSSWKLNEPMGIRLFLEIPLAQPLQHEKQLRFCLVYFNILRIVSIAGAVNFWQSQGLL